ncbi:MAG: CmpA/NrtA family ABC transporter substrate-binding protein [Pseudomonadota bacterium]|jgi:ABC-type nitrate/sulfonate/bicarbonate transport system substrate-binding protein
MSERVAVTPHILSIGFMPLLDCALLVAAHEKGFAALQGLRLRLVREVSWANVRDRITVGHLDAAQMLGPMVLASGMGSWPGQTRCVAVAALGVGGNAITVSTALWRRMREAGARVDARPDVQARALAQVVAARARAGEEPLTLAMVFPFSCHHYQLRDWLSLGGIDADRDVRLVVVPPPLLVEAIRTGQVDGFCVGEPWSSLAVDAGLGTIVAVGSEVWPRPPEKVLGLRAEFLERNPGVVAALVRALGAAAEWAGEPSNRPELARLLAQSRYVGAPASMLLAALNGELVMEPGGSPQRREGFLMLDRDATRLRGEDAAMLFERMQRCGQVAHEAAGRALASYRTDIQDGSAAGGTHDARVGRG